MDSEIAIIGVLIFFLLLMGLDCSADPPTGPERRQSGPQGDGRTTNGRRRGSGK